MIASMILLVVMMAVTAVIAIYRWYIAHNEDEFLHIEDPTGVLIKGQKQTAQLLNRIDHWGIGLTVVTAVYAVALLIAFLYSGLK